MIIDPTTLTAFTSAAVALAATTAAWMKRRDDNVGRRIDQAFSANQELVDDLRGERADLLARVNTLNSRVEDLERGREENSRDINRLRDTLSQQAREMHQLRAREHELREWAQQIIVPWIAQAITVISALGGSFPAPPPPPEPHDY